MPLGPQEIYLFARHAGFSPDQAVTMTAIALAESGGNTDAHNPMGEDSRGLWQVNLDAHPKFQGLDASDPLTNARMAFEVSGGGADIGRWTVAHGDKGAPYLKFRDQAEAASRAFGENGSGQWNPPANYQSAKVGAGPGGGPAPPAPLPTVLPDGSNADFSPAFGPGGQAAATTDQPPTDPDGDVGQDSDEDGLLDRYEKSIGTDADAVDSDLDGFSDRDEILVHGTDPTAFGSNPLGATGALPEPLPPSTPVTGGPGQASSDDIGLSPDDIGVAPVSSDGGTSAGAATPAPAVHAATVAEPGPGTQFLGPATGSAGGNKLDVFLDAVLAQNGDTYVFGAETNPEDIDPDTFDCSELIEWAGQQAGVNIPDGSFNQYLHAKNLGAELTVQEALKTPGAMLFKFSSTPVSGGGRPRAAHVAISLGDGRTIEARSSRDGVGIFDAGSIDWTHGGFVPDLGTELSGDFGAGVVTEPVQAIEMGVDSDGDNLLDAYERLIGTDPFDADTDRDGFVDSVELYDHRSDPLDFTDNALSPGSTSGYRPPLTTDLPPGADQAPAQLDGANDVTLGSGAGSQPPFSGAGSSDPPPSPPPGPTEADPAPSEPDTPDPLDEVAEAGTDSAEPPTEPTPDDASDIEIIGDTETVHEFDDDLVGLSELGPDVTDEPLVDADDSGDFDGDA